MSAPRRRRQPTPRTGSEAALLGGEDSPTPTGPATADLPADVPPAPSPEYTPKETAMFAGGCLLLAWTVAFLVCMLLIQVVNGLSR